MKSKHTLYRTTNDINGKFYIGVHSTKDINDSYLGSGRGILFAIEKYGKENFTKEILVIFPSKEEALEMEEDIVDRDLIRQEKCYNNIVGGGFPPVHEGEDHWMYNKGHLFNGKNNPFFGKKHSKKTKKLIGKKVSNSLKIFYSNEGNTHPMEGRKHSEETKEKISKSISGKNNPMSIKGGHSEESKEKMRGPRPSIQGENHPFYGKSFSQKTKEKLSKNHADFSGGNHPRARPVRNIKTGQRVGCLKEASKKFGVSVYVIKKHCNNEVSNPEYEFSNN